MNSSALFITGTDTGVGKTRVATLLVRALRQAGVDAVGFKPVCCGDRDDAAALHAASADRLTLNEVNPVWFRAPLAPSVAALVEGRHVDVALIHDVFALLRGQCELVVVEGAGGWLVPLSRDQTMADLAAEWSLPVLVVAANRLGALNHTLLTVRAIQSSGLRCAGVLLNQAHPPAENDPALLTNPATLEELLAPLQVPWLGELPHGASDLPGPLVEKIRAAIAPNPSRTPRDSVS